MASEQLKTNKGAIVTEINGVKYFKLQSKYPGDYTKNCGLLGNEIDENFYFLRSYDIADVTMDENRNLVITRVDGDEIIVNIAEEIGQPSFNFDRKSGVITVTFPDGSEEKMDGFLVEGQDIKTATDASLVGDGTIASPLGLSEVEKTGTYAPAEFFIDLTVSGYTYYIKISDDEKGNFHYEEVNPDEFESEEESNKENYIEVENVPTDADAPELIKVAYSPEMPDGTKYGKGFRVVTKEKFDSFGLLYMYPDVMAINEKLKSKGSLWRVPSKQDWDDLLNAAERCDEDRNHDTDCINIETGKHAGARAKSVNLWTNSYREEDGYPVAGEDSLPSTGNMGTFRVFPVGLGEGSRDRDMRSRGVDNHDIKGFHRLASYWTSTEIPISGDNTGDGCANVYTRRFICDTRKVLQESSKPASRLSLRLVRDFDYDNNKVSEYENILGYNVPCVLISNNDTNYSKVWTSVNIGFKEFGGVASDEWSGATNADRNLKEYYYINEWTGEEWVKKQMNPGDSVVILDYDNDPATSGDTYIEWRVQENEDGTQELIDTTEIIRREFKEELEVINNSISAVCGMTIELSANTKEAIDKEAKAREEGDAAEAKAREEADKELWKGLSGETARAQQVEAAIWEGLNGETARAQSVETAIWKGLNDETARAQSVETAIWKGLNDETARASQVETAIWKGLNDETQARETVDTQLWTALNNEIDRSVAKDEQLEGNVNNIAELVGLDGKSESGFTLNMAEKFYNEVDRENLTDEQIAAAQKIIVDEVPTQITEESPEFICTIKDGVITYYELTSDVNFVGDAKTVKDGIIKLDAELANEEKTRKDDDTTLQTNIDNERDARISGDTALQANIDNEAQARKDADTELSGDISTLKTDLAKEAKAREDNDIKQIDYRFYSNTKDAEEQGNYIETNNGTKIKFDFDFNFGER